MLCISNETAENYLDKGQVYEVEEAEGSWVKLVDLDFFFNRNRFELMGGMVKKGACL